MLASMKNINVTLPVHKDISERLQRINPALAMEAKEILDENKSQRHIRGGLATKNKYANKA